MHRLAPTHEGRRAPIPGPAPGTEVHFVDIHRAAQRIEAGARADPGRVMPLVAIDRGDDRAVIGAQLHGKGVGIGLQQHPAIAGADFIFIGSACADTRHEDLPDAGYTAPVHPMHPTVPVIELADDAHACRIGRPYGKVGSLDPFSRTRMRPESVVDTLVLALAKQIEVVVRYLLFSQRDALQLRQVWNIPYSANR